MHGGLHPHEMANVLIVGGAGARAGRCSPLPAGTVDVAPTILTLLGVDGADAMAGRVLAEAFNVDVSSAVEPSMETVSSGSRLLRYWRLGDLRYLDAALP